MAGANYNSVDYPMEEDDLISDLPDCLIQHLLSFLPSTKDSIRTCVLSKRWRYQWTRVPLLIFNSKGMSIQKFPNFIDNALISYNSSKINKFVINSNDTALSLLDSKLALWIRFATERDVKELILECFEAGFKDFKEHEDSPAEYILPQFLFNNPFLVKLKTHSCFYMPIKGKVNWASLKALYIGFAVLPDQGIENVLSGSLVIECLKFRCCYCRAHLDFASKSLKTLIMIDFDCFHDMEISCPNLEKLELLGHMEFTRLKCKDLPPSVCVTLDFEVEEDNWFFPDGRLKWVKEVLLQLHHVEELKLGPRFFMLEGFVKMVEEKFWESDGNIFDCLGSHLKTIAIVNLHSISHNGSHNNVLKFGEFLLKSARMLEKMVFLEAP